MFIHLTLSPGPYPDSTYPSKSFIWQLLLMD